MFQSIWIPIKILISIECISKLLIAKLIFSLFSRKRLIFSPRVMEYAFAFPVQFSFVSHRWYVNWFAGYGKRENLDHEIAFSSKLMVAWFYWVYLSVDLFYFFKLWSVVLLLLIVKLGYYCFFFVGSFNVLTMFSNMNWYHHHDPANCEDHTKDFWCQKQ